MIIHERFGKDRKKWEELKNSFEYRWKLAVNPKVRRGKRNQKLNKKLEIPTNESLRKLNEFLNEKLEQMLKIEDQDYNYDKYRKLCE